MDWLALQAKFPRDRDLTPRATRLNALTRVLDGTLYNDIANPFSTEFSGAGEYIKIEDRRPSVQTSLCSVVVEDSVALLFSEGHWPTIKAADQATSDGLTALVKDAALNEVFLEAATQGSVGSIAIRFRAMQSRPFFDVMPTAFLVPTMDPQDPSRLAKVTQRYKVRGSDLRADGYEVAEDDLAASFWFQRVWDQDREIWYAPQKTGTDGPQVEDASRTVTHGLGFVPIVWIRNLPGGVWPEGRCTFERAIGLMIESDYLLSQAGRALKYTSDPKVVLTVEGDVPPQTGGSGRALILPPQSDAKLLELSGGAANTVREHVRELRAIALEVIHGNRAHADSLKAATSGRSIELMMGSLILLADQMRLTYGEGGLLSLLRMVCAASQAIEGGVEIGGQRVTLDPTGLELRWPPWMPPMPQDVLVTAQALSTAYAAGVISLETAVSRMAAMLGVDDVTAEQALVKAQADARLEQAAQAAASALADRQAANEGKTETRQVTA